MRAREPGLSRYRRLVMSRNAADNAPTAPQAGGPQARPADFVKSRSGGAGQGPLYAKLDDAELDLPAAQPAAGS